MLEKPTPAFIFFYFILPWIVCLMGNILSHRIVQGRNSQRVNEWSVQYSSNDELSWCDVCVYKTWLALLCSILYYSRASIDG
jgi:hypothetical protein